ncbi:FK506-binding protein 2-like [Oryza glaberrima]|uniref:Pterin-binding domain-containing protein n=2 Tax=Oryza TaxID=4527 RepID=A0A0D3FWG8_9ORYZ|nr:FK506-binding protein 2-like [Oryza glaberrima]
MAVLKSLVACKGLALCAPAIAQRHRNTPLSASAHRRQILITGLTMNSSGINSALPVRGAAQIPAVGSGPPAPSGGNLPIPSMPSWAKWVVGAIIVAIPIYRKIRALEDTVEKTAEVAIEVVDTVAEATEKVAGELADAFPGNENLKEVASKIKTVADVIEDDAEKAEALIQKVDEIKKELDAIVDPIIDKIDKEEL